MSILLEIQAFGGHTIALEEEKLSQQSWILVENLHFLFFASQRSSSISTTMKDIKKWFVLRAKLSIVWSVSNVEIWIFAATNDPIEIKN